MQPQHLFHKDMFASTRALEGVHSVFSMASCTEKLRPPWYVSSILLF